MNTFGLGLVLNFTDNATSGIQRATGAFNDLERSIDKVVNAESGSDVLLGFAYSADKVGREIYQVGREIVSVYSEAVSSVVNVGTSLLNAQTQLSHLYGSAEAGNAVIERIKNYAAQTVFEVEDLIPTVVMLKAHGIEAFDEIATSAYRATNGVQGYSQTILDYASDLAAFNPSMSNIYGKGIEAAMGAIKEYIAEGNAQFLKRGASLDINQLLGEETGKTAEERSRQIADLIEKMGMVGMTAGLAGTPMQKLANISDVFYNIISDIANSGVMDMYSKLLSKISEYIASIPQEELKSIASLISSALVELLSPLEKLVDLLIQVADKVRTLVKESPEIVKYIVKGVAIAGVFAAMAGAALKLSGSLAFLVTALSKLFGGTILSRGFKLVGIFKSLLLYVGPLASAVFLLKQAWDRNFLGMQDTLKKFIRETIDTLKILFDAWGDYTLSEDNFERAKKMGLLPFIEAVLQLKYHLGFLFKGIKAGFDAFFDGIAKALTKMGILDKETHGFRDLVTTILEKITQPGMTNTWEKVGYWIGKIGGYVLLITAALPIITKIVKAVIFLGKAIGVIVGIVTTPIVAIPLAIAAVIYSLYKLIFCFDEVKKEAQTKILFIRYLIEKLKDVPIIGDIIRKVESAIGKILNFVKAFIETIKVMYNKFMDNFAVPFYNKVIKPIIRFFNQYIVPIAKKVVNFFLNEILPIIIKVIGTARELFSHIFDFAMKVIPKVLSVIIHIKDALSKFFYMVYEIFRVIVLAIANVFKWLYVHIIKPIINVISEAFSWVKEHIIDPIINRISDKIKWLKDHIIVPIFGGIKSFIEDSIQHVKDFVMPIIDVISEAISKIAEKIKSAVDVVGDFFSFAGDYFKGIGDDLETMLGLSTGGYVKETGAAVLHPNEVVLNDILTQRLGNFLRDYDYSKTHQVTADYSVADRSLAPQGSMSPSPIQNFVNNTSSSSSTSGDTDIDNSVVFESGSIVFNVDKDTDLANMSEVELGAIAEKLMRIMARKAQLKSMQTRK